MGTWVEVGSGGKVLPNTRYRLRTMVKAPYTAANVELMKRIFRAKFVVQPVRILSFEHAAPAGGMYPAHGNGPGPFPFTVVFETLSADTLVTAGLDPRTVLAIAALVIVSAASFMLISTKLEQFVESVGETIRDNVINPIVKPVLSPVVLVAALAAFYIYTKGN